MSDVAYSDGDNFIRNMVTVRGRDGRMTTPPARKMTRDAAALPISVADLMDDLRVDSDDEAETLERMELGACAVIERRTGYVLIPGRYQVDLPGWWTGPMEVMRGPLRELVSVTYLAAPDGAETSVADLAGFYVEEEDRSFAIRSLSTFVRPELWSEVRRVRLTFDAGFRQADETTEVQELEDGLRTCLTMLVGHYYQNRELFAAGKLEALDAGGRDLLGAYRQFW